jgi:hypothetical protein
MKKFISIFSIAALAALSFAALSFGTANAQVMLQKAVISSGGGTASNSTTRAQMTTAQPVTGTASNQQMKAEYGFWTSEAAASSVSQTVNMQVGVEVWPNPASDIATANVTLANPSDLDVQLFDMNGIEVRSVFSGNSSNGTRSFQIDLSGLASGSYILAARIPGQIVETRISVVR